MTSTELLARYVNGEREFASANLEGANLTDVVLEGVVLSTRTIASGRPARLGICQQGYELIVWPVVRNDEEVGILIRCGCRTFSSLADARNHWSERHPDQVRARLRRAQLDAFEVAPHVWAEYR